jgi:xanthine dehydrogenase molybdopterin-binding subunit B
MTEKDLLRLIEMVDKRREQKDVIAFQNRDEVGRLKPLPPNGGNGGKSASAKQTAAIVGTSARKVERARRVISDQKEKEAV